MFDATFWPLLPTTVWQPLALVAAALVVATLIGGRQQHKKQKAMLYIAGLSVIYVASIFIDWRSSSLFAAQLYSTILLASVLLIIGLHLIIEQLQDADQKHTSLTNLNHVVARVYQAKHPAYSYGIIGALIGLLEPTHYSMQTYSSMLLLRSSFSSLHVVELLTHVLLSLSLSLVIFAAGYLLVKYLAKHPRRYDRQLYTLYAGIGLVMIASIAVALASFVVRL